MDRQKKKRYVYMIIALLVILFGSILFVKFGFNTGGSKQPGGIIKSDGPNHTAYILQTKYENSTFGVVYDDPADYDETARTVMFRSIDSVDLGEGDTIWQLNIKPNTYVVKTLDKETYSNLIDGYCMFDASLTISTVIIPVDVEKYGVSAYAYVYVQSNPSDKDTLVQKSLNDVNSHSSSSEITRISGEKLHMSTDELIKYFDKWKMEKFTA